MKFEDIEFYERAGSSDHELGRHVGRFWDPKKNYETVWNGALVEIPKLDWTPNQTVRTISGVQDWENKRLGYRFSLGRCLKYFVDEEMLPLRIANPGNKGTRNYGRTN